MNNPVEVTESQCGKLCPMKIAENVPEHTAVDKKDKAVDKCCDKFSACAFSNGMNSNHQKCVEELNNAHLLGKNSCPKSMPAAMAFLNCCRDNENKSQPTKDGSAVDAE